MLSSRTLQFYLIDRKNSVSLGLQTCQWYNKSNSRKHAHIHFAVSNRQYLHYHSNKNCDELDECTARFAHLVRKKYCFCAL